MRTGSSLAITACLLGLLGAGLLAPPPARATTVSGVIATDTVWDLAGSPYLLDGDVFVTNGSTLRILAGVQVNVTGPYGLFAGEGATLRVEGNASAPVFFTGPPLEPLSELWGWTGIVLNDSSGTSSFANLTLERAVRGIEVNRSTALVERSEFRRNLYGITWRGAVNSSVARSVFRWNFNGGMRLLEGARGNRVENSLFDENNASWQGGMFLEDSGGGNLVRLNTFRGGTTAIGLEATNASDPDRFYQNNFRGTVRDNTGLARWNDTYGVGGNFWGDYPDGDARRGPGQDITGPDAVGDVARHVIGAWPTPYTADAYPRMCERLDAYPDAQNDSTPPGISLTAPSPREFPQAVQLNATVQDDHRCHRGGYVNITRPDGSWVNQSLEISGANFTGILAAGPLGDYGIDLWALDAAGNVAHLNATVTVRDTTTPVIENLSGEVRWEPPWTILQITAKVTDNHGLASVVGNITRPSGPPEPITPYYNGAWLLYVYWEGIRVPGTYAFCFSALDLVGLSASACASADFVDTDPPTITGFTVTPAVGELLGTVDVDLEIWDNALWLTPTTSVEKPDGWWNTTMAYRGGSTYRATVPITAVGIHRATVHVEDTSGNFVEANQTFLTVDSTPPSLVVSVPARAALGRSVLLNGSGTADASGIAGSWWNFTHQGNPVSLPGLAPNFTFQGVGSYPLQFTAVDGHENPAVWLGTLLVEVDDPPSVTAGVSDPAPEVGIRVQITAAVADDFGVTEVWALVETPSSTENATMSWNGSSGQYERWNPAVEPERHNVTVWVRDTLGQWGSAVTTYTPVDTLPPLVGVLSLILVERDDANQFTLLVQASDNHRVAAVRAEVRAENGSLLFDGAVPAFLADVWRTMFDAHAAGNLTVCATATDPSGNNGTRCEAHLVVDSWAPHLLMAFLFPDPAEVGANVTLNLVAEDNVGLSGLWVNVSGAAAAALTPASVSGRAFTYLYAPPLLGLYTMTVTAVDLAGLRSTVERNFTAVDTTPPTAEAGPDRMVSMGGTVNLNGSASWDAVGIANFTWEIPPALGGPRWGAVVALPATVRGGFEIVLRVTDLTGLSSTDSFALGVVDDTPPSLANVTASAQIALGSPFDLACNATDNDQVAEVRLAVLGPAGLGNVSLTPLGGDAWAGSVLPWLVGTYSYVVSAQDASGLWALANGTFEVVDMVRPRVRLDAPVISAVLQPAPVYAYASDEVAVLSGELEVRDPSGATSRPALTRVLDSWTTEITYGLLGTYVLTFTATDAAGNSNATVANVTVVDLVPPAILSVTAPAGVLVGDLVTITAVSSDAYDPLPALTVSLVVSPPSGPNATYPMTLGSGIFSGSFTAIEDGLHYFEVQAVDLSGNRASLRSLFFASVPSVVDTVWPTVTGLGAASVVTDAATAINATFNASDDTGLAEITARLSGPEVSPPSVLAFQGSGAHAAFWNVTATGQYEVQYEVHVTAVDLAGHITVVSILLNVTTGQAPIAVAGPDVVLAVGGQATFNAVNSTDDFGIVNYSWTFDGDSSFVILYGVVVNYTFDQAGAYSVTLRVRDAGGRVAIDRVTVTVQGPSPPLGPANIGPVVALLVALAVVAFVLLRRVLSRYRERQMERQDSEIIDRIEALRRR